jgi:hypothetical protein
MVTHKGQDQPKNIGEMQLREENIVKSHIK